MELYDGFVPLRDDDLFSVERLLDQPRKMRLGFVDSHLLHATKLANLVSHVNSRRDERDFFGFKQSADAADGRRFKRKSPESDHGPPKIGKHNFLRRRAVSRFPLQLLHEVLFICVNLSNLWITLLFFGPSGKFPRTIFRGR